MSPRLSSAEAAARGRIGGYATAARYDTRTNTQQARSAFRQRFLDLVDPKGELSEAERVRRAEAARRAFYAKLALKSARARAARAVRRSVRVEDAA